MPARPYAFPRSRRLKRRRLLRPLFDRARPDVGRVRVGPVVLLARTVARADTGCDTPVQVCFAPGRVVRGVGRVRLRRVMRETFRLHQQPLLDAVAGRQDALTLVVLYRGAAATAEADVVRCLPEALRRAALRATPPHADPRATPSGAPRTPGPQAT
ncbi:MAG TPA: ribonuclease P protein component [Rubricoccaceae bacterium]